MSTDDSGTGSKKSWDDWSDLEVNKAIAEWIGFGYFGFYKQSGSEVRCNTCGGEAVTLDYCNNPADAWPVIVANGISMQAPNEYFDEWYASKLGAKISCCHKKPLRAAAIVFLEMNGVKPNV